MSQLTHPSVLASDGVADPRNDPAYARIADAVDVVGQRYRGVRIVRGMILFVAAGLTLTVLAAFAAHEAGEGKASSFILYAWGLALVGGALAWIAGPLLIRPRSADVARMIETRVDGLHNGLTNSMQLAAARDLHSSPWLGPIFDEVSRSLETQPVEAAVKFSDLNRLALRCAILVVVLLGIGAAAHTALAHGLKQMFSPGAFVPKTGAALISNVSPGDVTLIAGQALEVSVSAESPNFSDEQTATLIIQPTGGAAQTLPMTADATMHGTARRFDRRIDHVDATLKYRVEIAGTQSNWFTATVVNQVKLNWLSMKVTAPAYLVGKVQDRVLKLTPAEMEKTPVAVQQGSKVELTASIDTPVSAAMLQTGDSAPAAAEAAQGGRQFTSSFVATSDTSASMLLTQGSAGQIVAKVPDPALPIHVTPDAPPVVQMKSPATDVTVAPSAPLSITAHLKDDFGLRGARLLLSTSQDAPLTSVDERTFDSQPNETDYVVSLDSILKADGKAHGRSIRVQVEATDIRNLSAELGPQTVLSPVIEIRFRDPEVAKKEELEQAEQLRALLTEMLKKQKDLLGTTQTFVPANLDLMGRVNRGQSDLRAAMRQTAETYPFMPANKFVQKTLQILAANPGTEAVDLSAAVAHEQVLTERTKLAGEVQTRQKRIIATLESLIALVGNATDPTTRPTKDGGDLKNEADALKQLNEDLKSFMKQEQRVLDQTAQLAKKPVDNWDDNDRKKLADLAMSQEKLDAFMQGKVNDVSKLGEQDMSASSLLQQMMEMYSEVTMAKGALQQKAAEIAVPLEESGLELAKEISTNIEKWLATTPDRQQWSMEDPADKTDTPMPELPKELDDMIGELMEQQEDLFQDMEDAETNWADSMDKGVGWGTADGPIADMSAKGVTGNQLPNDNNMNGRSGEGRSGKSQGEYVQDTATGKGGRNTETRLDPTPFEKGQVKDTSKDPVGGATGGGKMSGQGGEGLEGPVPPAVKEQMQRLAQKQAQLRNEAERINLQYKLGQYDNFKLLEAAADMRRVESDINANRYQNALRRRDVTVNALDTSHSLVEGQMSVKEDTTPTGNRKTKEDINQALSGELPAAWSDALKEYYKKLGEQ